MLVSVADQPSPSGDSSLDEDEDKALATEFFKFPFAMRFMELVVRPAILKLPVTSISQMKGAGSAAVTRRQVHMSDWAFVADQTNRKAVVSQPDCNYLKFFYVFTSG